ncbi:plant/T7A14-6 protein [Senna tora]|uniref:Plant/T7A14-6 protein n=1 Tax=Senna tora TaxID=362788 RepID=A0A834SL95_9FABA|nr:plant/T7A14-6 protein [Senna tora]
MAMNQSRVSCSPVLLKVGLGVVALCIAGYILGPPLYWHFVEAIAALKHSSSSCAPCVCDCSSEPILSIPQGLSNTSFGDCAKHDPEVNGDTEKNFAELLSEELKLRETEALENQRRADMALLEAKKITSQYQKEADKCNSGMETCEDAREKAEAALVAQKKLTVLWELRARQKGWKEGASNSHTQSQGKVQTA